MGKKKMQFMVTKWYYSVRLRNLFRFTTVAYIDHATLDEAELMIIFSSELVTFVVWQYLSVQKNEECL